MATRELLSKQKIGDNNPAKRPEIRKKISLSVLKLGMKGEKHPHWKGGLHLPYVQDWTMDLKESIRKRDKYTCQLCCTKQSALKEKLNVHHIDYDKTNCDPDNLISLCRSCHAKTNNTKRESWKSFFSGRTKKKGGKNENSRVRRFAYYA